MARFFRLTALLLFGLLLPRLAQAQCVGAGGVPFNCTPGGAIGSSDLLLGGQSSNTVKFTAAQISSFVLGGTQPGVFSSITVPSGGGGELDGVFTGNPTWSGTSTFNGPLDLTPTGGSAVRSQQDIDADVTNVLSFTGVDPTGVSDSTSAFLSAIATGKSVYVPTGNYIITDILALQQGQLMYGDGRTRSNLLVYGAGGGSSHLFNLAALGVVRAQSTGDGTGSIIRDLGIEFFQGDTSTRGSIVAFPPAIYAENTPRFQIVRVRVSAANVCLDATGNSGGAFINSFECAAFTTGMKFDGSFDVVHVYAFHFWNFGVNLSSGLGTVFQDGNTLAASFGRVDGLILTDFFSIFGSVDFTSNFTTSGELDQVSMDQNTQMTIAGSGTLFVGTMVMSSAGSGNPLNGVPTLNITNGTTTFANLSAGGGAFHTVPPVQTSGNADVTINGGTITSLNPAISAFQAGGLHTRIRNVRMTPAGTSYSAPFISQVGSGALAISNSDFGTGGSGVGISYATDNILNRLSDNIMGAWTITLPGSTALGLYGLNSDRTINIPITINGAVHMNGGNVFVQDSLSAAGLSVNAPAGTDRNLFWQSSNLLRWDLFAVNNAETGGNAGSDLELQAYADDGVTVLYTPILVTRSTGDVTFNNTLHLLGTVNPGGAPVTFGGPLNLPGIVSAANCTGQPSKSIIATTGTGVLVQCP